MKKHLLTLEQFERVKAQTRMTPASLRIVRRVLVDGERQAAVFRSVKKSRQHVSEIVNKFWGHFLSSNTLPDGWKVESVALPIDVWPQVRAIEERAKRALTKSSSQSRKPDARE